MALAANAPLDPMAFNEPIRVACVGDSITQGAGAARGDSYPSRLHALLDGHWDVRNFGVGGRTLLRKGDRPYWNEQAFTDAKQFNPNVVIILLGANDSKPGNWKHGDEFAKDYADLIGEFSALPSKPRIYVGRPCPAPKGGNFGINEETLAKETVIIERLAREKNLDVIDLYTPLAGKPQLQPDKVHPNAEGYRLLASAVFTALTGTDPANITRPADYFRDHVVLQRGRELPVWGTAPAGTTVTVEFAGQKTSAVSRDGAWRAMLKPLEASAKPEALTIRGTTTSVVKDVLVGDVWVASGQSNMERQLGPRPGQKEINDWKAAAAAANYPLIRQFYVFQSTTPTTDAYGRWSVCTPTTAPDFTSVGFFFARELQPAIKVPVGIIHSSWGGTYAETWMSPAAVDKVGAAAFRGGKDQNAPSRLWKAMMEPLTRIPVTGVIWYQGENNVKQAMDYRTVFPALIADWRAAWNSPDLPFLFVQIAPYKDMTPELRESQLVTWRTTPHTAMVVTADVGDAKDIHPTNKAPVGERLALAARAMVYGEKIEYAGPVFRAAKVVGQDMVLSFDHLGGGLKSQDGGELKGFCVAGADQTFVPAKAVIRGETVVVSSGQVATPVAVRYGWANVPEGNLVNQAGLPASPFRSDEPTR
jgi:sialate O-acetylesterase